MNAPDRRRAARRPARPVEFLVALLPAAALLGGCASDDDAAPPDDAPAENLPPSAPGALGGVVLEEPALRIALDWQPASDADGRIDGYRVERDGVSLATSLAATEFLDTTVEAGTSYRYTVAATDDDGAVGDAAAIELVTPEAVATINRDNHEAVVAQVLAVYAGALYDAGIFVGPDFVDGNSAIGVEVVEPALGVVRSR